MTVWVLMITTVWCCVGNPVHYITLPTGVYMESKDECLSAAKFLLRSYRGPNKPTFSCVEGQDA